MNISKLTYDLTKVMNKIINYCYLKAFRLIITAINCSQDDNPGCYVIAQKKKNQKKREKETTRQCWWKYKLRQPL